MNGKHLKLSGYQLSLLPTGPEILKRDERETGQIDTLIELNDKDSIILNSYVNRTDLTMPFLSGITPTNLSWR